MNLKIPRLGDDEFGQDHTEDRRLTVERDVRNEARPPSTPLSVTVPWRAQQRRDRMHESLDRMAIVNRRLVAVAFADVAGFSKLMELNDVGTLHKWRTLVDDVIEPRICEHNGSLIHVMGDGLLVEFHSAVDAVHWALDVQQAILASKESLDRDGLVMRIGINVEDAILDRDDIHGDGVNIAARVQQLASPGEVLMTAAVHHYVWNKLDAQFCDLGERKLKNINRPVHIYRLETSRTAQVFPRWARPLLAWNRQRSSAAILGMLFGITSAWAFSQSKAMEHLVAPLRSERSVESTRLPPIIDEPDPGPAALSYAELGRRVCPDRNW